MSATRMKKLIVILGAAAVLTAGAAWLTFFFVLQAYSPTAPNQASDQTHPLHNHGRVVYITGREDWVLNTLGDAFFLFGIGAGLLNARWKVIRSAYDERPKKLLG